MTGSERPLWACPSCGHRFVSANIRHARTPTDVDAIKELPALLCEGSLDLGQQESLRRQAPAAG